MTCSGGEYEAGGGNCMMNKNCCDRTCNYGSESQSCGSNSACVQVFTSQVTTPAGQRTNGCEATRVRVTQTPCQDDGCRDCQTSWSEWSSCSVSCGTDGRQTRNRIVNQPAVGKGTCNMNGENRQCMPTPVPCPVPCVHSPWSPWSACGGTCAPALRNRILTIRSQPMFGGTACPSESESDLCFDVLPVCVDATTTPRPPTTPFIPPTNRPTPPPSPGPTVAPTPPPAELVASFAQQFQPTRELTLASGVMLAINTVDRNANVLLTWANGAVGVRDTSSSGDGVLAHPYACQIQFPSPRALRKMVFLGWSQNDSATLFAVNRQRRRAVATVSVEIKDQNMDLFPHTAIGFDTFELRPNPGASFSLVSFDAPMPDASKFVPPTAAPGAGTLEPESDPLGEQPVGPATTPAASGGLETWMIAVIVVGAVLLVVCVVVLIVVYIVKNKNDDDDDDSMALRVATQPDPRPTSIDSILNGGTVAMRGSNNTLAASQHQHNVVPPPNMYEATPSPHDIATVGHGGMTMMRQQQQQQQQQQPYYDQGISYTNEHYDGGGADHGGIAYGVEPARTSNQYGRVEDQYQAAGTQQFNTHGIVYNALPSGAPAGQTFGEEQIKYSGL